MREVMPASTTHPDFKQKLASFFEGCKRIHAEYHPPQHGYEDDAKWNMTWLKRYVRIEVSEDNSTRVWCFVDIETGEVLTGSWKAPRITKTSKGNIFDEHNGLKHFGPLGVAYVNDIKQTA